MLDEQQISGQQTTEDQLDDAGIKMRFDLTLDYMMGVVNQMPEDQFIKLAG